MPCHRCSPLIASASHQCSSVGLNEYLSMTLPTRKEKITVCPMHFIMIATVYLRTCPWGSWTSLVGRPTLTSWNLVSGEIQFLLTGTWACFVQSQWPHKSVVTIETETLALHVAGTRNGWWNPDARRSADSANCAMSSDSLSGPYQSPWDGPYELPPEGVLLVDTAWHAGGTVGPLLQWMRALWQITIAGSNPADHHSEATGSRIKLALNVAGLYHLAPQKEQLVVSLDDYHSGHPELLLATDMGTLLNFCSSSIALMT